MNFKPVSSFTNYIDAHIVLGKMENAGLICWLKDEHTVTIDPILTNALGGIKLMVAEQDLAQAQLMLQDIENEKRKSHACLQCGSHNIELVSTPRKMANWLSAITTFLLTNLALTTDKVYHCFDCGFESKQAAIISTEEV